jgi:hypothetical protein
MYNQHKGGIDRVMNNTKNITSDQKSLMAFTLLLSDPAFQAWMGETPITPEIYKEICSVSAKFRSPELIVKICERFPGMAAASHL